MPLIRAFADGAKGAGDAAAAFTQAAEETEMEVLAPLFFLKNVGVLLPGNWTRGFNGAGCGTDYLTRLAMATPFQRPSPW